MSDSILTIEDMKKEYKFIGSAGFLARMTNLKTSDEPYSLELLMNFASQKIIDLRKDRNAYRQLCREMVKELKMTLCIPDMDGSDCPCDKCFRRVKLIARYEELEKGQGNGTTD